MAQLGVNAATAMLAVAWPPGTTVRALGVQPIWYRLLPSACSTVLVSGTHSTGFTLYHWDLPQALQDLGGWTSRDTSKRFADYAYEVVSALGERVRLSW